jgi:hypothetical protein
VFYHTRYLLKVKQPYKYRVVLKNNIGIITEENVIGKKINAKNTIGWKINMNLECMD